MDRNQQKTITYDHLGNNISTFHLEYYAQAISPIVNNTFFLYNGFDTGHKLHRIRNWKEDSVFLEVNKDQTGYLFIFAHHNFYQDHDSVYFFQPINDTIYKSVDGGSMDPLLYIDFKGKNIPTSFFSDKKYENVKDFFDNLHKRSYAYGVYSFIRSERFTMFGSFYQKNKKLTLLIMGITIMLISLLTGSVQAASQEFGLQEYRKPIGNTQYGYKVSDKYVWKIVTYSGSAINYDKTLYCLKAEQGFFTSEPGKFKETYDLSYDFMNRNSMPTLPVPSQYYNQIVWILNHAYIPNAETATTDKTVLLQNAGITGNHELTDDDIDVVQQLAIWYFTNYDDTTYHKDMAGEASFQTVLLSAKTNGVVGEYVAIEDTNTTRYDNMDKLFVYFVENAKKAADMGVDMIVLTGNPGVGVDNRAITKALADLNEAVGDRVILTAGKMHASGILSEAGEKILTKEDAETFIEAGADVLLLPAPGTVPGFTMEHAAELIKTAHEKGVLAMTTIGTSQEGADEETIRQIALMCKMAGADIHHIGDSGYMGMALPENITAYSVAIRGKRHTYRRMAMSLVR
mgnify:CR=1 FL=1